MSYVFKPKKEANLLSKFEVLVRFSFDFPVMCKFSSFALIL